MKIWEISHNFIIPVPGGATFFCPVSPFSLPITKVDLFSAFLLVGAASAEDLPVFQNRLLLCQKLVNRKWSEIHKGHYDHSENMISTILNNVLVKANLPARAP